MLRMKDLDQFVISGFPYESINLINLEEKQENEGDNSSKLFLAFEISLIFIALILFILLQL